MLSHCLSVSSNNETTPSLIAYWIQGRNWTYWTTPENHCFREETKQSFSFLHSIPRLFFLLKRRGIDVHFLAATIFSYIVHFLFVWALWSLWSFMFMYSSMEGGGYIACRRCLAALSERERPDERERKKKRFSSMRWLLFLAFLPGPLYFYVYIMKRQRRLEAFDVDPGNDVDNTTITFCCWASALQRRRHRRWGKKWLLLLLMLFWFSLCQPQKPPSPLQPSLSQLGNFLVE